MASKTSLMDPRFGPAWIAFAHTFAFEGEHDHAVTAYSTCARMFAGCVFIFFPRSLKAIDRRVSSGLTCPSCSLEWNISFFRTTDKQTRRSMLPTPCVTEIHY